MPPEILSKSASIRSLTYDAKKADVWSVGVLLFLLLDDDFPWSGQGKEQEMARLQTNREITFYNNKLSEAAKEVLNMHFEPDPLKRTTIENILKHPWFDEDCWKNAVADEQ